MTGVIVTLEKVARSPAGVPRQRIWLEHRSRQEEDGHPRDVQLRIAVVLVGSKTGTLNTAREGQRVRVTGFLSRAGYKGDARDRLQMIAETLVLLD
ncbi:primosomal replication protein N [Alloalcanivorax mobilis]|uniref:primosomal replication protein N n=1 Tax=Alloalcanivorax mobilis TaxID=2019569 RepID=UPI0022B7F7C1|nr:primosomal replication protein N [Alloalcanivorax mobilis]